MFKQHYYGLWSEPFKCWFCDDVGRVFATPEHCLALAQQVTVEQDTQQFRHYAGYDYEVKRIDEWAMKGAK